ncbi:MAG: hypothetical protein MZW92_28330 [Comamonadaceae bacterium]|nr:hypothetical protein [Comamonadaceae bacterium]
MGRVRAPAPAGAAADAAGKVRDLFEGTPYELTRADPDANQLRRLARRPAHRLRLRPGGREAHRQPLRAGRDGPRRAAASRVIAQRRRLGLRRAALQPRRRAHRLHRQPPGPQAHDAGAAGDLAARRRHAGEVVSAEWDHEVHAPLHWEDDGQAAAVRRRAARPAATCGASTCPTAAPRSSVARRLGAGASTRPPARW